MESPPDLDHPFRLKLARSSLEFEVPSGKSILECLHDHGIDHDSMCRAGVCGTCEAVVLEGMPDHRDMVLTDDEREEAGRMMPCVSRCIGSYLVLDL